MTGSSASFTRIIWVGSALWLGALGVDSFAQDNRADQPTVRARRVIPVSAVQPAQGNTEQRAAQNAQQAQPAQPGAAQQLPAARDFGGISIDVVGGSIVIQGPPEQVEALVKFIEQIDQLSLGEPALEVVILKHADAESLSELLTRIYTARETSRVGEAVNRGRVSFIPVARPNAVVVIAQNQDMKDIVRFVEDLDAESGDPEGLQYRIFKLKQANARIVQTKIATFLTERADAAGIRLRADTIADERTNSVIVFAGPADMRQVELLIQQLDGDENSAINELEIFILKNYTATELYNILLQSVVTPSQAAAQGLTTTGAGLPGQQAIQQPQFGGQQGLGQLGGQQGLLKSTRVRIMPTEKDGKPIESGILEGVNITPDDRSNSLIVTAPPASMELVRTLIARLDAMPNPAAQLKVFPLKNHDATSMQQTLESVFGQRQQTGGGNQIGGGPGLFGQGQGVGGTAGQLQQPFAVPGYEAGVSLVPLTFTAEVRTNSIIATGTERDLIAAEALVLKIDSDTTRERKTIVYRLQNLTSDEAFQAMDDFLSAQADVGQLPDGQLTFQQQIASEVSVTPEVVSNTLIISASPRFLDEVIEIIEQIDQVPPQVVIQVLIAQITLTKDEDFGIELGGQSPILFDRSLVIGAGNNASLNPGYNFNSTAPLGNRAGVAGSGVVGSQGLTNFMLGRADPSGIGGFLFSLQSESVSVLLRALRRQQRLDVLSRPQIMTLNNQEAHIFIGQDFPYVSDTQTNQFGNLQNTVAYRPVGVELTVVPRINPDGTVIMRVEPRVESVATGQGVPLATDQTGNIIATSPVFNSTNAQTVITSKDGQTVVLGGLISKTKRFDERKVPWVGDWPVIGWAFKTRFIDDVREELLIILTPHVVYNQFDAERIKAMEARRMSWILDEIEEMHGSLGLPPEFYASGKGANCAPGQAGAIEESYVVPTTETEAAPASPPAEEAAPKTQVAPAPEPKPPGAPPATKKPAEPTVRVPTDAKIPAVDPKASKPAPKGPMSSRGSAHPERASRVSGGRSNSVIEVKPIMPKPEDSITRTAAVDTEGQVEEAVYVAPAQTRHKSASTKPATASKREPEAEQRSGGILARLRSITRE